MSGRRRGASSNVAPIRPLVAHAFDLRRRASELDDQPRQLVDRGLLTSVPTLKTEPCASGVPRRAGSVPATVSADVGEAPRLRAVAVHRQRLAGKGLAEEPRHHRSVALRIEAGPIRVEVPHDRDRKASRSVREREVLVQRLGGRVRPALHARRPQHTLVVLRPRNRRRLAVDLGRRRDKHTATVPRHRRRARARCRACSLASLATDHPRCAGRRRPRRGETPRRPPRLPCRPDPDPGSIPPRS